MYHYLRNFLVYLFTLICFAGAAQTLQWAKAVDNCRSNSFTQDKFGNFYTIGQFTWTTDFDPGPGVFNLTSIGLGDIFIQKLDASGNFVWVKSIGTNTYHLAATAISSDSLGNVYVGGYFFGTIDFDPGPGIHNVTSNGHEDLFVMKLDSSGNFQWVRKIGGSKKDFGIDLEVTPSGTIYVAAEFEGTVDFDPGPGVTNRSAFGKLDMFILKLNSAGNFKWVRTAGGSLDDGTARITLTDDGKIVLTGSFQVTTDFDYGPGVYNLTSNGMEDIFIQMIDTAGNFLWAKSIGGNSWDVGLGTAVDPQGNVLVTGYFFSQGVVDFDPGSGVSSINNTYINSNAFVLKLTNTGDFLWVNFLNGNGYLNGISVDTDIYGNIYAAGSYGDTAFISSASNMEYLVSNGMYDFYMIKFDPFGKIIWKHSFGSTGNDEVRQMFVNPQSTIYAMGKITGSVDFDPSSKTTLVSAPSEGLFVAKFDQCHVFKNETIIACDSLVWINGQTYSATDSSIVHTVSGAGSCDSVISLNLTINKVSDVSTALVGPTISAVNSNASYVWLDCDQNYAVIPGETSQSFSPSVNGNYAVQLTENGCVDTSACVSFNWLGLREESKFSRISLYPNPTHKGVNIDLGFSHTSVEMIVKDVSGMEVERTIFYEVESIDANFDHPRGLYFIELISENSERTILKLIKL